MKIMEIKKEKLVALTDAVIMLYAEDIQSSNLPEEIDAITRDALNIAKLYKFECTIDAYAFKTLNKPAEFDILESFAYAQELTELVHNSKGETVTISSDEIENLCEADWLLLN